MQDITGDGADARLGMNVRLLRGRLGISGKDLAGAMRERGHNWHQNTVVRIESGVQAAKFSEARDLAAILDTSLDRLTWSGPEANATEALYSARLNVRRQFAEVGEAVFRLLAATAQAQIIEKGVRKQESRRVEAAREDLLGTLEECTLEAAVTGAFRRHGELSATAEGGSDERRHA